MTLLVAHIACLLELFFAIAKSDKILGCMKLGSGFGLGSG
jgi:hypothetical protein